MWEYKRIKDWRLTESLWKQAEQLGREGWELVTSVVISDAVWLIFKRPINEPGLDTLRLPQWLPCASTQKPEDTRRFD